MDVAVAGSVCKGGAFDETKLAPFGEHPARNEIAFTSTDSASSNLPTPYSSLACSSTDAISIGGVGEVMASQPDVEEIALCVLPCVTTSARAYKTWRLESSWFFGEALGSCTGGGSRRRGFVRSTGSCRAEQFATHAALANAAVDMRQQRLGVCGLNERFLDGADAFDKFFESAAKTADEPLLAIDLGTLARAWRGAQSSLSLRSVHLLRTMEETVCIVKPDAVLAGLTDRVLAAAEEDGFYVVRRAEKRLTPARARAFYAHLEGTNAFRPACEFLSSGPVVCAVLSKVNAVNAWRERVGPTDPVTARETSPTTIRAQLGVDKLRNVVHASSSHVNAAREKAFLFPTGPKQGLVPKEYLLETLVMPGLVEALGEMYVAQPTNPYTWMARWFDNNAEINSQTILEEWPTPVLRPNDALQEASNPKETHKIQILGPPMYEGTWNFRRCKDRDPIYGVGACDADGLRSIINGLRKSGHDEICYFFLENKPVVFIGGEPVVVVANGGEEDAGGTGSTTAPYAPQSHTYSTTTNSPFELERMESRLRSDVCASADAAAEQGGGVGGQVRVLGGVVDEGLLTTGTGTNIRRAAPSIREVDTKQIEFDLQKNGGVPDPRTLSTVKQVFHALHVTRSETEFIRAPTPRHGTPTEHSFERIVEQCMQVSEDAALVFGCCDGIDRTTTGMIAGCLVWRGRSGALEQFRNEIGDEKINAPNKMRPGFEECEFSSVTYLVEQLSEFGLGDAKRVLDVAINACDALFDLRSAVNKNRVAAFEVSRDANKKDNAQNENKSIGVPAEKIRVGLLQLERYCWLLVFAAYCVDRGASGFDVTFGQWTRQREGLRPKSNDMALA